MRGNYMKQKPVILQVLPALGVGGLEQGAIDIAEAIVKGGGRALIAGETGSLVARLRYVGGEHVEMSFRKRFSWRYFSSRVQALRELIKQEKVDLVHARSRYPGWVAAWACKKENVPLVTTWHGVHKTWFWPKKLYNSGLLRGQRVIAVSEHIAARLKAEYSFVKEKLRVIPRGSDPEVFSPDTIKGERMSRLVEQWNVEDESRIILMPGRLTRWKGQEVLIGALGYLAAQYPDDKWVCVLAGPGVETSYAQSLYRLAEERGVAGRLRFVGACSDMAAAYNLAQVVVVPSQKPEPFGRVSIEAQMMGCWVVGSADGGVKETVSHGATGTLVAVGDSQALAQAIKEVLDVPPEFMAERKEEIRARALAHYTKGHMQEATLAVYEEVAPEVGKVLLSTFMQKGTQADAA